MAELTPNFLIGSKPTQTKGSLPHYQFGVSTAGGGGGGAGTQAPLAP